jgi:hypothetical protein
MVQVVFLLAKFEQATITNFVSILQEGGQSLTYLPKTKLHLCHGKFGNAKAVAAPSTYSAY